MQCELRLRTKISGTCIRLCAYAVKMSEEALSPRYQHQIRIYVLEEDISVRIHAAHAFTAV